VRVNINRAQPKAFQSFHYVPLLLSFAPFGTLASYHLCTMPDTIYQSTQTPNTTFVIRPTPGSIRRTRIDELDNYLNSTSILSNMHRRTALLLRLRAAPKSTVIRHHGHLAGNK
jgi:hypothetical protein